MGDRSAEDSAGAPTGWAITCSPDDTFLQARPGPARLSPSSNPPRRRSSSSGQQQEQEEERQEGPSNRPPAPSPVPMIPFLLCSFHSDRAAFSLALLVLLTLRPFPPASLFQTNTTATAGARARRHSPPPPPLRRHCGPQAHRALPTSSSTLPNTDRELEPLRLRASATQQAEDACSRRARPPACTFSCSSEVKAVTPGIISSAVLATSATDCARSSRSSSRCRPALLVASFALRPTSPPAVSA